MFWKKNTLVVTGDHSGNEKEATDLTGFLNPHDCFVGELIDNATPRCAADPLGQERHP